MAIQGPMVVLGWRWLQVQGWRGPSCYPPSVSHRASHTQRLPILLSLTHTDAADEETEARRGHDLAPVLLPVLFHTWGH